MPSRSSTLSSESSNTDSISYRVDWSDRAQPTSHCWFPFRSDDPLVVQSCAYVSCTDRKSTYQSTFLQCESCTLVVHSHHLNDSQTTKADFLPSCRSSFADNTMMNNSPLDDKENPSKYDEHFWLQNNTTITHALDIYSSLPNIRICVFGGDGTVGWILGRLAETYPSRNNPPVSIGPLGTGNDLSRVLAWGEQYDPKRLFQTLVQIPEARVVTLDRWKVRLEQLEMPTSTSSAQEHRKSGFHIGRTFHLLDSHPKFVRETNRASYQDRHELPNKCFINYMSFGLDAAIALDFHEQRTRNPSKFSSPWKNKLMYLNESCKYLNDFATANMWDLSSYIRLTCDGYNLTDATRGCHTLVILNIPGYASGTNPWGKPSSTSSTTSNVSQSSIQKDNDSVALFDSPADIHETDGWIIVDKCDTNQTASPSMTTVPNDHFNRQDFGDQKIEVVGLNAAHMAAIHIGFHGKRIAQCSQLRIGLRSPMTAQMDGEPFYLPASVAVNIGHAGQVLVLKNENK
ncbi:unnamed protein product [Rotaria sp. Silwood1]|nr:unnamed protein product [Rotaria sp. Silwood1]